MSYQFDHRQLADEMELYFFNEQVGAGLPIWLPNGVAIRDALEAFVKRLERGLGYKCVVSPHIAKESLFASSGHLRSFGNNMFPPMKWSEESECYYLKPMNCPHHHKVFASSLRSYRDLPLRISEYGQVYRFENSGSLRGLVRARSLCQNDAHIYVDPENSLGEIKEVLALHERCYMALGLRGYRYRLSKYDPLRRNDFDGAWQDWQRCESILRQALQEMNLPFFEAVGEAAFYGPKIDVQMKVGPNEEESVASVQLDFNSASKFGLNYVAKSGESRVPWIVHRAPLGSHERFVALLLEYYDGQLPAWLSPVQLYLLPVNQACQQVAENLAARLVERGIRVVVDNNSGSLSKRILFAHRLRPFAKAVVGDREIQSRQINIQLRERQESLGLDDLPDVFSRWVASP